MIIPFETTKSFEHFSHCIASVVVGKLLQWDGNKKATNWAFIIARE